MHTLLWRVCVIAIRVNWQQMVNTDQDKGWGLTPLPFPQRSCVTIVTSPGHVPPIVEPYSPGSATHPVRGQMSHRPLALVTTLQLSASDPNKHWNKLRDGERTMTKLTTFTQQICTITFGFRLSWQNLFWVQCSFPGKMYSVVETSSASYSMSPSCGEVW